MSSNQRPDTLMQDRISQVDEKLLQRTAGPYIGSLGPCARARMFPSAGCGHGGALALSRDVPGRDPRTAEERRAFSSPSMNRP
jgi:hypothetical protein